MTSLIQDRQPTDYPSGFTYLPGVEHHFGLFREFTKATFIGYTPIVSEEDMLLWITYSQVEAENWLLENPQEVYRDDQHGNDHHEDYRKGSYTRMWHLSSRTSGSTWSMMTMEWRLLLTI
jgi:hypothetical protein